MTSVTRLSNSAMEARFYSQSLSSLSSSSFALAADTIARFVTADLIVITRFALFLADPRARLLVLSFDLRSFVVDVVGGVNRNRDSPFVIVARRWRVLCRFRAA